MSDLITSMLSKKKYNDAIFVYGVHIRSSMTMELYVRDLLLNEKISILNENKNVLPLLPNMTMRSMMYSPFKSTHHLVFS